MEGIWFHFIFWKSLFSTDNREAFLKPNIRKIYHSHRTYNQELLNQSAAKWKQSRILSHSSHSFTVNGRFFLRHKFEKVDYAVLWFIWRKEQTQQALSAGEYIVDVPLFQFLSRSRNTLSKHIGNDGSVCELNRRREKHLQVWTQDYVSRIGL